MNGWIKLHRSILNWGWYNEPNMVQLFTHLILIASTKDNEWHGEKLKRGDAIVGLRSLSVKLGLTDRKLRTCINRLKSTHEITTRSTHHYTIITICKYEFYQNKYFDTDTPKSCDDDTQPTHDRHHLKKERSKEKGYISSGFDFLDYEIENLETNIMSVKRLVNSRIWSDKWIETLSTAERLLWLYLLTNDQTNMLGIYEITLSRMVFETGLTKPQVAGALKRFEQDKRAYYFFEDYIFMVNHFKNQEFKDSVDKKKNNMLKSAEALYYKLPQNVLEKLDSMGFDSFERLSTPSNRLPILDSDSDSDSEQNKNPTKKRSAEPFVCPDLSYQSVWDEWKRYRKEIKKPIVPASEPDAYEELIKLSGNDPAKALKIVKKSKASGWQGLFELDVSKPPKDQQHFQNRVDKTDEQAYIDRITAK